jgi:hypothetical protein
LTDRSEDTDIIPSICYTQMEVQHQRKVMH